MTNNHKAAIAKLEKKITALNDALSELGDSKDLMGLIPIIHRPGWTTLAELTLVLGILEAMSSQAETLGNLKAALVKGSSQVGA